MQTPRSRLVYPVLLAAAALALVLVAPASAVTTKTFEYTGAPQAWTVPTGITSATFDLFGASGGPTNQNPDPGGGGRATATIAVTPLEDLQIYVGGEGLVGIPGSSAFNGGGVTTAPNSAGGGGASDVRRDGAGLTNRILVAGGGGGDGGCLSMGGDPLGGSGGGLTGGDGVINPTCATIEGGAGKGGTQSSGGAASSGTGTGAGSLGVGGAAPESGGSGGGGYYGGGGARYGGGGGGSGFGPAGTTFETRVRKGNGLVTITYAASPLTITGVGTGAGYVESSVAGIDCGRNSATHTGCAQEFPDGTVVTLTAHPHPITIFAGFSGSGCSGAATTCQLTMSEARSVTADFTLEVHRLAVITTGSGSGYVDSSPAGIDCGHRAPAHAKCADEFELTSQVVLTAHPGSDLFTGFSSGGCSGAGAVCTVTMDAAKSVTATFQLKRRLTVSPSGNGSGTISGPGFDCGGSGHTQCTQIVSDGSRVQLTATPASGSDFVGFTGACSGAAPVCTATITADSDITAIFSARPTPATTAPRTTIIFRPQRTGPRHSIFNLRSSQPNSRFECSLDGAKFKPCGKRIDYPNLKPGRHVFRARTINAAGEIDRSPAVARFRVRADRDS